MKIHNRILSSLLSVGLCLTLAVPAVAADEPTFSDVPASHWAFDEIESAVDSGIVNGYADGTFKPTGTVTNAHFAAMIAREYYTILLEQFDALPEGQANWWYGGIATCGAKDILDGTKVGNEHESTGDWGSTVNAAMSRYDMAQAMYNLLKEQGATMPSEADQTEAQAKIGDWSSIPANYQDAVAVCYALGLLNGQSDGTFSGQNNMNRAQACVVIDRLNQYIEVGTANNGSGDIDDTTEAYNGTLANGKEITEENVKEILEELKEEFPEGMAWGHEKFYASPTIGGGGACNAFAYMISDRIFGKYAPLIKHQNFDNVKVGDIIWTQNSENSYSHLMVVTNVDGNFFDGCSGNTDGKVSWSDWGTLDKYSNANFSKSIIYSRYPSAEMGNEPDDTEAPAAGALANGEPATEENVMKILEEIKAEYPQDSPWGEDDRHSSPVFGSGRECASYAFMVSDRIFGTLPKRVLEDHSQIRPGDVIEMKDANGNTYHWEVATTSIESDGYLGITSGNNGGLVGWGWSSSDALDGFVVWTRYPD